MNNPDITMEEYIRIETEKAIRRAQVYNWETATYGKIMYFEDIDYFKNFETKFPAIVYEDALTSEPKVSPEPTVSPHHVKEVDLEFEISFSVSDDEDYTVHRLHVLDFDVLMEEMDQAMTDRLRMVHPGTDGQVATYKPCLEAVVGIHVPLVRELMLEFFSTYRFANGVLDLDTADTF
ncbi:hypothetical protein Tco_0392929 [Tanacetum coccineum]